jgi:hypothetical protein
LLEPVLAQLTVCLLFCPLIRVPPGGMDSPMPASVLSALAKLRGEVEGELEKGLGAESGTKLKENDMESRRRVLELVAATEKQLAAQGQGWQGTEEEGPGASMEVRAGEGSAQLTTRPLITVLLLRNAAARTGGFHEAVSPLVA